MLIQPYGSFKNVISPYSKVQECFVPHGHPCEHIVKHVAPALSAFVIDSRYKNKGLPDHRRQPTGLMGVPWTVLGAVGRQQVLSESPGWF